MKYKKWKELSRNQKIVIAILGSFQLSLLVAALSDIYHRPAYEIKGKKVWWVLASFVDIIGPLAYFKFGRDRESYRKDFL